MCLINVIKMFPIKISLVILILQIHICPSCYAICENYYIIMEKGFADYAYYKPINKENINGTISSIKTNNETNTFDMNCVLNLNCAIISADRPRLVFHESISTTISPGEMSVNTSAIEIPPSPSETGEAENSESELEEVSTISYEEKTTDNSTFTDKNDSFVPKDDLEAIEKEINTKSIEDSTVNIDNSTHLNNTHYSTEEDTISNNTESSNVNFSFEEIPSNNSMLFDKNNNSNFGLETKANTSENDGELFWKFGLDEDTTSSSTENSTFNFKNGTNFTEIHKEIIQKEYTNLTHGQDNEVKNITETPGNINNNKTNITVTNYQKYNPEESKTLATKIVAGTLGAIATVGVFMLAKFGVTKLIEHCLQRGVYRIPDP